ncbi:MAG: hypothetical protein L0Y72_06455 [Gemmataceae bacterium]|nr:hypothetical protein [Gemmataceae bacterium]MCI0738667.1 hypothetical protein [Gemmataceae bacterium]
MSFRKFAVLLVLPILSLPAVARAGDQQPTLVVRVGSIDALLGNIKALVKLAGQEEAARNIEALIQSKIGDNGLEGVDRTRPMGAYGRLGKELDDVQGALLIPIANETAFLKLLKNLQVRFSKDKDDIYTIETGAPVNAYFRFANKYCYVTALTTDALLPKNMLDPAKVLAGKAASVFSATLRIDQLPEAAKLIAAAHLEQELQKVDDAKHPGDSAGQRALRSAGIKEFVKIAAAVLKDGKEFSADVGFDKDSGEIYGAFALSALPGSALANEIAGMGKNKGQFGGLMQKGAAFNSVLHFTMPDSLTKALTIAMAELESDMRNKAKQAHAAILVKALTPTVTAGQIDCAFNMLPSGKHFTLVGAVKVKEGQKLEGTLRELLTDALTNLPAAEKEKIKLDADSVSGVKIHRFNLPEDDPGLAAVLGDSSVHVAFRDDAVFVALGKGGLAAVKSAVTAKAEAAAPIALYEVDMARLAPLFAQATGQADLADKLFPGGRNGTLRFVVEGGSALTVRFHTHAAVLQFLGQMKKN